MTMACAALYSDRAGPQGDAADTNNGIEPEAARNAVGGCGLAFDV